MATPNRGKIFDVNAEGRSWNATRRAVVVALSQLVLVVLLSCKRAEPAAPNVLLITLDTLRADHVGAYGGSQGVTPAIDGLAAGGVRFQNAISSAPLTLPSHATILSGALPLHHGLRNNGVGSFPASDSSSRRTC